MKSLLLVVIGMVLLSVTVIGPVAAATASGTTAVTGNPRASVSIALNESSVYLDLDPATSPNTNASLAIIVSTNIAFGITVQDNTGRAGGDQGYMGNYTGSYVSSPLNTKLGSALSLTGTTNSTTTASALTPPITATPQTLYTGSQKVSSQWLTPNTFSQAVTFGDPVLPSGSVYRIDLQFTITSA